MTGSQQGPRVVGALGNARASRLDDRGLVPLAEARVRVAAATAFRQGDARMLGGTSVTDADLLWADLLSLEDAAEFVRDAMRLRWEFHVRGRDNTALLERYGDGILPWLESRLDARGVLRNVPWCVVPCLLGIDRPEALAIALRTRAVHDLLPGQAPLGHGPGAFAGDRIGEFEGEAAVTGPENAEGFLGTTRGFELAKDWLAAHPRGVVHAVALARSGDADARALLVELASQVGSATLDVLGSELGEDAAKAAFAELDLPLPTVPPEVEAVLADAEPSAVPRGPVLALAALDAAARQFDFPLWDNANIAVTAAKVRGWVSPSGDVLAVETIQYHPGSGEPPSWVCDVFASRPTNRPPQAGLIDEGDVETRWIDEDRYHLVEGYANVLRIGEHGVRDPFEGEVLVKVTRPLSGAEGEDVAFPAGLPEAYRHVAEEQRDAVGAISFAEAAMVQIGRLRPDLLFPTSSALADALGVADAELLFELDDVAWPFAGEPVSTSLDFVTMLEALRRRRRLRRLPGPGNTTPLAWLPACAEMRSFDGPGAWPEGDPFALTLPAEGPGATPVDSSLLLRGWPHGVTLLHDDAYNAKGSGRPVVAHVITGLGARWFMNSRVGACAIARAAGSVAKRWELDDRGVAASLKKEGLLEPDEARALLAHFVAGPPAPFGRNGAELVLVMEALVGPSTTLEAYVAALEAAPRKRWSKNADAVAAGALELGILLRRARAPKEPLREALERAFGLAGLHEEVHRALDLVLHGRAGAERSARAEGDYLYVDDDRAWARARCIDPATPPSVEDLALLPIAGDALIDKYAARFDRLVDPVWLAAQLPRAGSPKAAQLLARLSAK